MMMDTTTMKQQIGEGGEITEEMIELFHRANDHADELFVGESRTSEIVSWDDGDFRIEIYSGFDTRRDDIHHGEQIRYKHSEGEFRYSNFARKFGFHADECLQEYVIEEVDE